MITRIHNILKITKERGVYEMKEAYPVLIKQCGKDYLVYVPDLELYTEGKSMADAMEMARDAIGLKGVDYIKDATTLPAPSNATEAIRKAKEEADEDFDYSDGVLTLVDVDFEEYRRRMRNRAVKKNCTIPYWMSEEADKRGANYSRLLQEALLAFLGGTQGANK